MDMDRERCDPVEDSKDGEIFLSDRIHLGAIKDGFGLLPVDHLFLGEGSAQDMSPCVLPFSIRCASQEL